MNYALTYGPPFMLGICTTTVLNVILESNRNDQRWWKHNARVEADLRKAIPLEQRKWLLEWKRLPRSTGAHVDPYKYHPISGNNH